MAIFCQLWLWLGLGLLCVRLVLVTESATVPSPAPQLAPNPPTAPAVTSSDKSVLYFNDSTQLRCDESSERIPSFITTTFLRNGMSTFGCQVSSDKTSFYVSVTMSGTNFPNTAVWVANRLQPVKDNASLYLDSSGSLVLHDSNGLPVWSSNTPPNVKPAGLRLQADGNLILFDEQNLTIWESFSEPIDLLVPGQYLNPGSMLVSGFFMHSTATGLYSAVMKLGGLVLYVNSTTPALPYFALKYPWLPSTVESVETSPCNHTQLRVAQQNVTQIQAPMTPACQQLEFLSNSTNSSVVSFVEPIAFVRLDPDGVLRGYYPSHRMSYVFFNNMSRGLCGVPNVCGPYGVCLPGTSATCKCAYTGNQSYEPYFVNNNTKSYLLTNATCTPRLPLDCTSSVEYQRFLFKQGIDYFANDHIPPTMQNRTLEDCQQACAKNCSCKAAFYRKKTKQCYLHEDVLSMISVPDFDYVVSIKLQMEVKKNSDMKLILGISITSGISLLLFGMWLYHKGVTGRHKLPFGKDDDDLLLSLPGQPKRFSFKELQAATWEFSQKLGVGGFGSVYRGVFSDGSSIAVKRLENITTTSAQGLKEFRNEVLTLSNINHQNLVHLRGFCAEGIHRLLVYEYVPNGSLDTWLFRKGSESPGPPLDWKTRKTIAVHTARGLFFLHEQCRNCIVHLDIKPQNILLDENFLPKISDFGLSRLIHEDQNTAVSRMRGTPGYMAPECLIITDATEKSDVYSFGMVLLEIISGRKNVDVSRLVVHGDTEGWYFPALAARKFREGNITDIIDKSMGTLNRKEIEEAIKVIEIAFWCIQDQPTLRPTMGKTLLMLEGYSEVPQPPLSCNFGMRFHLTNTIPSSPQTPRNNDSATANILDRDVPGDIDEADEGKPDEQDEKDDIPLTQVQQSPRPSVSKISGSSSPIRPKLSPPLGSPTHHLPVVPASYLSPVLSPRHSSYPTSPVGSPRVQHSPQRHSVSVLQRPVLKQSLSSSQRSAGSSPLSRPDLQG